jgi:hypothetical protein
VDCPRFGARPAGCVVFCDRRPIFGCAPLCPSTVTEIVPGGCRERCCPVATGTPTRSPVLNIDTPAPVPDNATAKPVYFGKGKGKGKGKGGQYYDDDHYNSGKGKGKGKGGYYYDDDHYSSGKGKGKGKGGYYYNDNDYSIGKGKGKGGDYNNEDDDYSGKGSSGMMSSKGGKGKGKGKGYFYYGH